MSAAVKSSFRVREKEFETEKAGWSGPLKRCSSIRLAALISSKFKGITEVRRAKEPIGLANKPPLFSTSLFAMDGICLDRFVKQRSTP